MLSPNQVVRTKAALERGYIGTMDVYAYTQTTSATTHRTSTTEVKVLEAVPCRLSHDQSPSASNEDAASVSQSIKVFYSPEIDVDAGSKLVITQNGVTKAYRHSGVETVYDTHKEVVLELLERWT